MCAYSLHLATKNASDEQVGYELIHAVQERYRRKRGGKLKVIPCFYQCKALCNSLHEEEKCFLFVDPGDTKKSCDDSHAGYKARLLMAASKDNRVWGGEEFKNIEAPTALQRH